MDILLGLTGAQCLEESVTYQAIIEEGFAKGFAQSVAKGRLVQARLTLFRQGEKLFSQPADASARSRIEAIDSLEVLEHLSDRILSVRSWEELLADLPTPEPRRGRRKGR